LPPSATPSTPPAGSKRSPKNMTASSSSPRRLSRALGSLFPNFHATRSKSAANARCSRSSLSKAPLSPRPTPGRADPVNPPSKLRQLWPIISVELGSAFSPSSVEQPAGQCKVLAYCERASLDSMPHEIHAIELVAEALAGGERCLEIGLA